MKNKKIGFCHGVLYKRYNVYSKENIDIFKKCKCNAIEINCHLVKDINKLNEILFFIKDFDYISLHLPCDIKYKNNSETNNLLKKIEDFYIKSGAKLAIVHPDLVEDWDVFDSYVVNWAIENMDDRKERFKNVKDLKEFFKKQKQWSLVLDLGHCNSNDKTMSLAEDLISNFKNKIKEIHLSGYEVFHDPLHRTKQIEIIKYCNKLNVPIIIESVFEVSDNAEDVEKEYNYIINTLNENNLN